MEKQRWILTGRTILASACCSVFVSVAAAQSTEMDRPTRLSSPEASIRFDASVVHYYSFTAGPGEFTILVAAQHNSFYAAGWMHFTLYDQNMKEMQDVSLSLGTNEKQEIHRYTLSKKSNVLLKVSADNTCVCSGAANWGRYRFRLSGAIDVGGDQVAWITGIPHEGILTVKMKDGSSQEIDLKKVAGISIR